MAYSLIAPTGVIFPIILPPPSVNQSLPSAPFVMPYGNAPAVGIAYSVIFPVLEAIGKVGVSAPPEKPLPPPQAARPNVAADKPIIVRRNVLFLRWMNDILRHPF